jgi:hypothetical protein
MLTSLYFVVENYMAFLGSHLAYTDVWCMRFFLTIFVICMIVLVVKLAYVTFMFEFEPTLIDIYKKHMDTNPYILDTVLGGKDIGTSRRLLDEDASNEFKKRVSDMGPKE